MRKTSKLLVVLAAASVAKVLPAQTIPIRSLDPNGILHQSTPRGMANGIVVGDSIALGKFDIKPTFWDASGPQFPPLFSGDNIGIVFGVNRAGDMVGTTANYVTFTQHAVLWSGGVAVDINTLVTGGPPMTLYFGSAIDDAGRIVGAGINTSQAIEHAFLLDHGQLTDLGALNGGAGFSEAYATNGRGTAVGMSSLTASSVNVHACVFEGGTVIDLHDPTFMTGGDSVALDVDRDGRVVGLYTRSIGGTGAFLWDRTQVIDLGQTFPGGSEAVSANDFGVIVGTAEFNKGVASACVWTNGVPTDLNTLIDPASGWLLTGANAIDDEGRISGIGALNGNGAAFLMEPDCDGSFTIYGTGCAGSGGVEPQLLGSGCPAPDRDFALAVLAGAANVPGLVLLGLGTGVVPIKPGCDLQVLPLALPLLPVVLDNFGEYWAAENLPAGTPVFDLNLQVLLFDPGAAHGIASTKPLALHFE